MTERLLERLLVAEARRLRRALLREHQPDAVRLGVMSAQPLAPRRSIAHKQLGQVNRHAAQRAMSWPKRARRRVGTIQIGMRLPSSEHESSGWRIAEITPDFRLEDVWALPAQGSAEDFGALLEVMASLDPAHGESAATRLLFSIRYRLGGWFGWEDATRELEIPGNAETTLSARLPCPEPDARGTPACP